MHIPDLNTARLRLVGVTPYLLSLQESDPMQLGVVLGATMPPDWPGPDWDAATYAFIRRQFAAHPHTIGWHRYVLLREPEPVFIGALGAHPHAATEAELGYGTLPPWQGQGYATEATQALLAFLFTNGNRRVSAQTYPSHAASLRVMSKCGMTFAGAGDEPNCVRYAIDRQDTVDVSPGSPASVLVGVKGEPIIQQ